MIRTKDMRNLNDVCVTTVEYFSRIYGVTYILSEFFFLLGRWVGLGVLSARVCRSQYPNYFVGK